MSWLFPSLHGYRRGWLRGDLIAGLTVWAVLVPEALAYASIAGVSPVVGLYAAPGALILYAALGSSRQLIAGPMSATAALSAATVAALVPIKSGLPTLGTPNVHLKDLGTLVAGGIGVMLVGFAEGLGAAKTYAAREHYEIDANRELLGLGGANVAAGLSSGMVVNGSLSKTAVNGAAGARTQLSGLIVAALSILTLLALTGLFEDLPEATLAAIVIAAVIELVDYHALIELYRAHTERLGREFGFASRPDFIAAVAALLGVTVFDTLPGLFIGIGISLLLLIYRASRPYIAALGREPGPDGRYSDINRHPENELPSHVAVLRIESSLYFANADAIRARVMHAAEADGITAVVLDAENPAIAHFYPTVQAAVAAAGK